MDKPVHFTVKQVISWIIAATITLSSLSFAAGKYNTEFSQMKQDIVEGKEIAKELTKEIKLLREELQKISYANKR